jgi:phage terminase large subunit GpA-like protein
VVYGPVTANEVWQDLDDTLRQRWPHPHGGTIGVDAAVIDAGSGGHYDVVMKFCEARTARWVWAGKGVSGFSRPAFQRSSGLRSRDAQRLYLFGADSIKSVLFSRLKRGQSIRFSSSLDASYFEQLCSERLITKFSRGRPVKMFERIPGKRAETLDCLMMAYSARQGLALLSTPLRKFGSQFSMTGVDPGCVKTRGSN